VAPELREADLVAVRDQLGRDPTTPFTVVARCSSSHPLVIRNRPTDVLGRPFPTTYWLTCPDAGRRVSAVESAGWIARLNERYEADQAFKAEVDTAHAAYAEDRANDLEEARSWGGVGGTLRGLKCLHAHYAFHIAGTGASG
jgi:hypothetical protein